MINNKKKQHKYYMYGKHTVFSALYQKKRKIDSLYCTKALFTSYKSVLQKFNPLIVPVDFIIEKIGKNCVHQGIIAYVNSIYANNINSFSFSQDNDKIVILDQITNSNNIGSIIRSAAAFNINKIIITSYNSPLENASIAKAACGCLEFVQIAQIANLNIIINKLKKLGFWTIGLKASAKNSIFQIPKMNKIAIIIGSEHTGMRALTTKSCDFLVKIDISDKVESLNASNAAAIIFHTLNDY